MRFHDLRHTCALSLAANGVPMEQVKEWIGHSEISTTVDIYGHLQYATKKQSAAAIEQDIVSPHGAKLVGGCTIKEMRSTSFR
ncbi:MAG: tyrosine-type recombinase/integrase [Oscillospiraceae bacterium]